VIIISEIIIVKEGNQNKYYIPIKVKKKKRKKKQVEIEVGLELLHEKMPK